MPEIERPCFNFDHEYEPRGETSENSGRRRVEAEIPEEESTLTQTQAMKHMRKTCDTGRRNQAGDTIDEGYSYHLMEWRMGLRFVFPPHIVGPICQNAPTRSPIDLVAESAAEGGAYFHMPL